MRTKPALRIFPATDRAFAQEANSIVTVVARRFTNLTSAAKQATLELRRHYPNAVIQVRDELAELGEHTPTWYAFRDGRVRAADWRRERLYDALAHARDVTADSERALERSADSTREMGYDSPSPVSSAPRRRR